MSYVQISALAKQCRPDLSTEMIAQIRYAYFKEFPEHYSRWRKAGAFKTSPWIAQQEDAEHFMEYLKDESVISKAREELPVAQAAILASAATERRMKKMTVVRLPFGGRIVELTPDQAADLLVSLMAKIEELGSKTFEAMRETAYQNAVNDGSCSGNDWLTSYLAWGLEMWKSTHKGIVENLANLIAGNPELYLGIHDRAVVAQKVAAAANKAGLRTIQGGFFTAENISSYYGAVNALMKRRAETVEKPRLRLRAPVVKTRKKQTHLTHLKIAA